MKTSCYYLLFLMGFEDSLATSNAINISQP
jgi:hypothetical protein